MSSRGKLTDKQARRQELRRLITRPKDETAIRRMQKIADELALELAKRHAKRSRTALRGEAVKPGFPGKRARRVAGKRQRLARQRQQRLARR